MAFIETNVGLINDRFVVVISSHVEGYSVHYLYGNEVRYAEATGAAYFKFMDEMTHAKA